MLNAHRPLLFFALFLMSWCLPTSSFANPRTFDGLKAEIQAILKDTSTPGAAVAIYDAKLGTWHRTVGVANHKTGAPATPETVFRLGSISKSFVTLTALRLVHQKHLDLNTPLVDLAPQVTHHNPWAKTHPLRLIHLLEHTSGLEDAHFAEYAHKDSKITTIQGLEYYTRARRLRWRPGESFEYSNVGPAMAAFAMESVSKMTFETLSSKLVLQPLQMHSTSWHEPSANMSAGHIGDQLRLAPYAHIIFRPSGALNTTAGDMARFLKLMVNQPSAFLSKPLFEHMRWPQTSTSARHGLKMGWASGSHVRPLMGHVVFGHGGAIDGFASRYTYIPNRVGWAIMVNKQSAKAIKRIEDLLAKRLLQKVDTTTSPSDATSYNPNSLAGKLGCYRAQGSRMEAMRFLSDLVGVHCLEPTEKGLTIKPLLGGEPSQWIAQKTTGQFRRTDSPLASLWLAGAGRYQINGKQFVRVSRIWAIVKIIALVLSLVLQCLALLSLLTLLCWCLFKRRTSCWLAPLGCWSTSVASLVICVAVFALVGKLDDPIVALGTPTPWSWGICISTILYVIANAMGALSLWRQRPHLKGRPWLRSVLCLVCGAGILVSFYMVVYGVVGIRFWAL